MLHFPDINTVGFPLGPITIHWYGLLEIISFVIATVWLIRRGKMSHWNWRKEQVVDLEFYVAVGAILGGRVGYIIWYNLPYYLSEPIKMLYIWDGGMSFHGGLLGVVLACWAFARSHQDHSFLPTLDFIAPAVPIGLGLGRLANFINDQLFGRVSHLPWAMVFPAGGPQPRQPSQIYEFLLEGVLLFLILAIYSRKARPAGSIGGMFVLFYGIFRFVAEFARQPDIQLGFVFGPFTMGQVLSVPMIIIGPVIIWWAYKGGFAESPPSAQSGTSPGTNNKAVSEH